MGYCGLQVNLFIPNIFNSPVVGTKNGLVPLRIVYGVMLIAEPVPVVP